MKQELTEMLKEAIELVKIDIIEEQSELDNLITQYQELNDIPLEDD